ncbi:hypothetical protein JXO59_13595 [candidate division KSB1 bacterium]|nr:hypothetical protein [candidate division KSB1 bacterium]
MRHLVHGLQSAGIHRVQWDGKNNRGELVPSGVYYLRVQTGDEQRLHRMIFMK